MAIAFSENVASSSLCRVLLLPAVPLAVRPAPPEATALENVVDVRAKPVRRQEPGATGPSSC